MKLSPLVNVIDVETTCWEPASSKPEGMIQEIIEIGIAVVDTEDLKIMENHSIYVDPQKSTISAFCQALTRLSRYDVMGHPLFQHAVVELQDSFKSKERPFISWGDFDKNMFESNCATYNCTNPFSGTRHLNLRFCFSLLNNLKKEPDLPEALAMLNLNFDGRHHSGKDDAANIAKVLIKTLEKMRS